MKTGKINGMHCMGDIAADPYSLNPESELDSGFVVNPDRDAGF
jgi:hypothetical protein